MNGNLRSRANRGFTIVELIVVVTVIGFLAAIAIGAYNKVVNDAKAAKSLALVNSQVSLRCRSCNDGDEYTEFQCKYRRDPIYPDC